MKPENLEILTEPKVIPSDIVNKSYPRYRLKKLTKSDYKRLKEISQVEVNPSHFTENDFPEGALVARLHLSRERDTGEIKKIKAAFIKNHGSLYCEACGWRPEEEFGTQDLKNTIIEAHHDVPLHAESHGQKTKAKDIRMLCPNCHRAIHKIRPWIRTEEFRAKFFKK